MSSVHNLRTALRARGCSYKWAAAAGYAAQGNWKQAAFAAGGIALAGVGLGAVKAAPKLTSMFQLTKLGEGGFVRLGKGAGEEAAALGYTKRIASHQLPFPSRGQEGFQKGTKIISRDVDAHKGGYWKMHTTRGKRIGTYTKDLSRRIGR